MNFSLLMSLYIKESPEYLNDCFNSVFCNQTIKPKEIVLVLDGPITEDLSNIINFWSKKIKSILKVIKLEQNVGLGNALNIGLRNCSNEWVFRMDTDDICKPDRFEKQLAFIESNPDVVLFGGQVLEFENEPNDFQVLKSVPTTNEEIRLFSQKRCPFTHMPVAYKKSIILEVGGYQHQLFMEDYNLWLRVIGAGYKVANLADTVLYARVGNGMYARRKGLEYIKSEKQLLNLKKDLKLQNPLYANMLFLIRSMFRLMPSALLGKIYNTFLRKKVSR